MRTKPQLDDDDNRPDGVTDEVDLLKVLETDHGAREVLIYILLVGELQSVLTGKDSTHSGRKANARPQSSAAKSATTSPETDEDSHLIGNGVFGERNWLPTGAAEESVLYPSVETAVEWIIPEMNRSTPWDQIRDRMHDEVERFQDKVEEGIDRLEGTDP